MGAQEGERLHVVVVEPEVEPIGYVARLLASQPDMTVVAAASGAAAGLDAIENLEHYRPSVAVVGLGLAGDPDEFWLIRSIRERMSHIPIATFAADTDRDLITRALLVSVDSFVRKAAPPELFADIVRSTGRRKRIIAGLPRSWIPPEVAARLRHPSLVKDTAT